VVYLLLYEPKPRTGRLVGLIVVRVVVTNHADEIRAAHGDISEELIRSIEMAEMLVDTGAITLALPEDVIHTLGLERLRTVDVKTAAGVRQTGIYADARLDITGRSATFECVALPPGSTPPLGFIPMELLGIEPDLANHTLRLLPEAGQRHVVAR
jgi:predicted aspartyl protease